MNSNQFVMCLCVCRVSKSGVQKVDRSLTVRLIGCGVFNRASCELQYQ